MRLRLIVAQILLMSAVALTTIPTPESAAQHLPPEMQVDRLLVQAEREIEGGDHRSAVVTFERIVAVCEEHGLEIPTEFWFRQAGVLQEAGLHKRAVEASTRYLQEAGREGEHYRAALEILDAADVGLTEARRATAAAKAILAAAEPLKQLNSDVSCRRVFEGPEFGGRVETLIREVTEVGFSAECRLRIRKRDAWDDGLRIEEDVDTVIGPGNVITPWTEDNQCGTFLGLAFGVREGVGVYGDGNKVVEERTWSPRRGWDSSVSSDLYVPFERGRAYGETGVMEAIRRLNRLCESRGK